jgi:hypothetical protein
MRQVVEVSGISGPLTLKDVSFQLVLIDLEDPEYPLRLRQRRLTNWQSVEV